MGFCPAGEIGGGEDERQTSIPAEPTARKRRDRGIVLGNARRTFRAELSGAQGGVVIISSQEASIFKDIAGDEKRSISWGPLIGFLA